MKKNWISNVVTVGLTLLILAAGIVLPPIIYPQLDPYMGRITQLQPGGDSSYIFNEPFSVYPWNIYDARFTRPLNVEQQQLLQDHNVPQYLLNVLAILNMPVEEHRQEYTQRILAGFVYLNTNTASDPPCLALTDCDLDQDGTADLQCAVDLSGQIISLLILNDQWSRVTIQLPEGASTGAVTEPATASGNTGNPGGTGGANGGGAPDNNTGQSSEPPLQTAPPVRSNDLAIWSFAFGAAQATANTQQWVLADSLQRIDLNFSYQYQISYLNWLRLSLGVAAQPDETAYTSDMNLDASLQVWTYRNNYQLYIYDLPTGIRIIFYMDARNDNCVGFNIQQFSTSAAD